MLTPLPLPGALPLLEALPLLGALPSYALLFLYLFPSITPSLFYRTVLPFPIHSTALTDSSFIFIVILERKLAVKKTFLVLVEQ